MTPTQIQQRASFNSPQSQNLNPDTSNTLQLSNVDKIYGNGVKALSKINLTLTKGMFGLLGPNGAGKSTLMRSIATLQPIDKGTICFNGTDISDDPNAIRRNLGYLPQEFGVYPRCSARKLLNYLAVLKGLDNDEQRQQQIDYLLERTNLSQYHDQAVADFSGGMRQRFGIAQALLANPKVLIVDEPTAGLDPQECASLHNLLCEVAETAIVLYSTHIVEDIQNLCSEMAVMNEGQLQFHGSPASLTHRLNGKVWGTTASPSQLQSIKDNYRVLSTRLIGGQHQVRIVSDKEPGNGFLPAKADLTDAYFHLLNSSADQDTSNNDSQNNIKETDNDAHVA